MIVSIESRVLITPPVQHVRTKASKAGQAHEINGVAATADLRRLQEKSLKTRIGERTLVVAKWGPISVHDARNRAAKDEYNRREAKEDEERWTRKKEIRIEVSFLRRWLRAVRGTIRPSLEEMTIITS